MNNDQIRPAHFARLAYVYIRQSSMQQVRQHTESQHRQRQLVQRAVALGWAAEQVVVIDEDLGQSAAATGQRSGFERLIGEVAAAEVLKRVSPVAWQHINFYGRYLFHEDFTPIDLDRLRQQLSTEEVARLYAAG